MLGPESMPRGAIALGTQQREDPPMQWRGTEPTITLGCLLERVPNPPSDIDHRLSLGVPMPADTGPQP